MQKYIIRREFLKLKNEGFSYRECKRKIKERFDKDITILTLKRWNKRFLTEEGWDLEDKSQRPKTIYLKFSDKDKQIIKELRDRALRNLG